MTGVQGGYSTPTNLSKNSWITSPDVEDPDNIPEPAGWTFLIRPYQVVPNTKKSTIIMPDGDVDYMSYLTGIGRIVAIGPCCWTRPEHRNQDGEQFPWAKVGDFISYPKHAGARRKYKGVSYVLLVDDEMNEKLPDPQVFDDDFYTLDIPEDHMTKYNTVYNKCSLNAASAANKKGK